MSAAMNRALALFGWLAVTPAVLSSCSDEESFPPPSETPPAAPATNDPAFAFDGQRGWYLIGDDLTPGHDTLTMRVLPPGGTDYIDAWVAGGAGIRLELGDDRLFHLEADLSALPPGEHEVLLAADGAATAFARVTFMRSHPLYFQFTTDWDFSDPSQETLDWQDQLNDRHPGVQITNFVGPYTFTDPEISDTREQELVDWLKAQRDEHGDEIALHIHPYCNFVEYAGLTCNTDDSTVYATDATGYTVTCESYGYDNFKTLLEAADGLFEERGLGKPTTFRAGGWTATIETLRALADTGYVADTSANNWARMEEWQRPFDSSTLYEWNMEHWAPIGDTSQPYYPNTADVLSPDAPTLAILEVPDNAIMVDYVTVEEMVEIFHANWPEGTALAQPTSFMMGYHPSENFSAEEQNRIDGILDHADQFLAEHGDGPVVYALLRDMPRVWPRPE